jgi:endonuclease VIII
MPEGPEIQIARDKVARVVQGNRLNRVQIPWPALQEYEERWTGRLVKKMEARGKALLFHFDCGDVLYTHNQLYGRWITRRKPELPKSNRTLRLAFYTDKGGAFLYSATELEVLGPDELQTHPYVGSLGPDILDPKLTRTKLKKRLMQKPFRNRQLASLYLDQSFLAGPGNYLRSEILFCAGLPPRAKPSQLSAEQLKVLATQTLLISRRAYETKGYTTEPALAEKLKEQGERRRSRRHYVFGRAGEPCRLCDGEIEKVKISSRSVFFCDQCQAWRSGQKQPIESRLEGM